MPRKKIISARDNLEVSPERLQAPEVSPDAIPQGMAVVRQQSDAKVAEETPTAYPIPPGPDDCKEFDRMLASAESVTQKRSWFIKELAKQKTLSETEGRRATFWGMESSTPPRASIVGRHLHDHGVTENRKHIRVHGFEVYQEIYKLAPHHLSEAAQKHVKHAQAPANRKQSKEASSYLIKDLKRRLELLATQHFIQRDGDRFWLSELGARVFNRWPWWSFKNDERNPRRESEPPSA